MGESDPNAPGEAFVQLHLIKKVDPELVTDVAEGLNRSLQVNEHSLANLDGVFEKIKDTLNGKCGHDQISYKMRAWFFRFPGALSRDGSVEY